MSDKRRRNTVRRGKPTRHWTDEEKAILLAFWPSIKTKGVCPVLNRTRCSVQAMADKMGLCCSTRPVPRALYRGIIEQEAVKAGVPVPVVMSKIRTARACAVRFRAWRRLNEEYGISAIARVAGKDFSTVLSGLRHAEAA